ncbi:MAG: arginase [Phycisphaerae bacterium]|nr:arginase [Phycisphaerae bacterium]MCZ2400909.1 arginase [Phycisphaerae bacterium]NUQ48916.1 arginase [Phycisphaerae bacterium]
MSPRTIKLLGIQAGRGAARPGAEDGPYVLRERGLVQQLIRAGHSVEDLGDIPGEFETRFASAPPGPVNHLRNVLQVNRHTHACVLGTRRKAPGAFLLVVGGDHSLAIGTLAGLSDACRRLGLLWIDAHADFNDPATSPSGNIHGMSLAVACGNGHRDLLLISDYNPMVDEQDVYLLGPRIFDVGERENLAASRVHLLGTDEWRARGIVDAALSAARDLAAGCDHLHVSFDIDVLDPAFVPGTGTPVPGGITADEARVLLAALGRQGLVASAEFVEYNPSLDQDGRTGGLVLELIAALLG